MKSYNMYYFVIDFMMMIWVGLFLKAKASSKNLELEGILVVVVDPGSLPDAPRQD